MKKLALVLSVFMLVAMSTGIVLAAEKQAAKLDKIEAQVVSIDAKVGQIVITANNQKETLKADPKLIEGIAVGEKVIIEKVGNMLKSIKKAEIVPPVVK